MNPSLKIDCGKTGPCSGLVYSPRTIHRSGATDKSVQINQSIQTQDPVVIMINDRLSMVQEQARLYTCFPMPAGRVGRGDVLRCSLCIDSKQANQFNSK